MAVPKVTDRRINGLLIVSVVLAAVMVVALAIFGPQLLEGASASQEVREGNVLTSCRATFRIDVDDANGALQTARARLDTIESQGLEAAAFGDRERLAVVIPLLEPARDRVDESIDRYEAVRSRYRMLVKLSRTDPDRFLGICRAD